MRWSFVLVATLVAGCADRPTNRLPINPSESVGGATKSSSVLDGTSWSVLAVNGRATPRGETYYLRFEGTNLSARFGCNGMSGAYRLNGDHLAVSSLAQTLMGCPDPAMRFEAEGGAVLQSNMRVERLDEGHIRLVSEAGSIDLELLP